MLASRPGFEAEVPRPLADAGLAVGFNEMHPPALVVLKAHEYLGHGSSASFLVSTPRFQAKKKRNQTVSLLNTQTTQSVGEMHRFWCKRCGLPDTCSPLLTADLGNEGDSSSFINASFPL
jgi:hypothetical protein